MLKQSVDWLGRIVACAALIAAPLVAATKPLTGSNASEDRSVWAPETLTGTIMMVDPAQHILVIQDANGVPFDLVVTRATRIRSGGHEVMLRDLSSDVSQKVSLRFVPERRGDVAQSVRLNQ